jgi:hypothetical protein
VKMRIGTARLVRALALASVLLAADAMGGAGAAVAGPRLAQGWGELSPREREDAVRNYRRFQQLSPDQRRDAERNYERWRALPPGEKDRIRGNYRRYREMSPEQRREFQRNYERWRGRR